jgi:TolB-like protein/Flp pilus assembly protein TadD
MSTDLQIYRFGEFGLNAAERQVLRGAVEVRLRPKAFETLLCLVQRHGHVVRKDELLDQVWGGTHVSEAVLTHCIAEVRRALEDDARRPRYVKTVSLAGYKFIAEVVVVGSRTRAAERSPAAGGAPPSAIAVLSFANLSGDPENEYFCDGLSEDLINGLSKVRGLRVVARSSSFSFKGRDIDAREIGRLLNVGSIVEGSVRKAGDRLRISAQLVDANEGYHVWSEQYDRRLEDVFAVQDEISLAILSRVTGAVRGEASPPLAKRSTPNMDAYRLYLKGRGFWHRRFNGCLQMAMACFQRAIEKDPTFALAYTGLADSYSTLGIWAFARPATVFPQAAALARQALEIDPTLAEAHASQGLIKTFHDWDWNAAGMELSRAVDLNPGCALIRLWNGHFFSIVGRWDEAIAEVQQAQDLDPLSPIVVANVGWTFSLARQQDRAIEELRKVLAMDPGNGIAHFYLGYAYAENRRYADALESFRTAIEATGGMPWAAEFIGWVHALMGDHGAARAILHESQARMKTSYIPSSAIALIYLGLGDDAAVFDWLAKSVDERDPLMPWMKSVPCFDRLRSDPRFRALLRRIGLVEPTDAARHGHSRARGI